MELKNRITKLLENYKKVTNAFLEEIRKWESNSYYTSDAKQDEIRKVKAQITANDNDFNKQLLTIITEEKEAILNFSIRKPDDFQLQISNAIGFINLLGDNLTDEQAFEMVKPFIGDYQTMKHFYAVLSNRYGKDGMKVTRFSLGLLNRAVSMLDVFRNNFANFFNAGYYPINGLSFTLRESAIIADAEAIENVVLKLDSIIPASYKEVEAEIEDEVKDEMGV